MNLVSTAVFAKSKPDGFTSTELEQYLMENQGGEIFMTGVFAEQCVYSTSLGELNRNYRVSYLQDAVASSSPEKIDKAVRELEKRGVQILETREILLGNSLDSRESSFLK